MTTLADEVGPYNTRRLDAGSMYANMNRTFSVKESAKFNARRFTLHPELVSSRSTNNVPEGYLGKCKVLTLSIGWWHVGQ
jgi:hypothetical protein